MKKIKRRIMLMFTTIITSFAMVIGLLSFNEVSVWADDNQLSVDRLYVRGSAVDLTQSNISGSDWSFIEEAELATFTFDNFSYSGTSFALLYIGDKPLAIIFKGSNTITVDGSNIIGLESQLGGTTAIIVSGGGYLTISGESDASLTVSALGDNDGGLSCEGDIEINSGTINITAGSFGLYTNENLNVNGGSLTAKGIDGITAAVMNVTAGMVDAIGTECNGIQVAGQNASVTISGGEVSARSLNDGSNINSMGSGIYCTGRVYIGTNGKLTAYAGTDNAEATECVAICGNVSSSIKGTGWADYKGEGNSSEIAASEANHGYDYKKIVFPASGSTSSSSGEGSGSGESSSSGESSVSGESSGSGESSVSGEKSESGESSVSGEKSGSGELSISGEKSGSGEPSVSGELSGSGELGGSGEPSGSGALGGSGEIPGSGQEGGGGVSSDTGEQTLPEGDGNKTNSGSGENIVSGESISGENNDNDQTQDDNGNTGKNDGNVNEGGAYDGYSNGGYAYNNSENNGGTANGNVYEETGIDLDDIDLVKINWDSAVIGNNDNTDDEDDDDTNVYQSMNWIIKSSSGSDSSSGEETNDDTSKDEEIIEKTSVIKGEFKNSKKKTIKLATTVTKIEARAFDGANKTEKIYINATKGVAVSKNAFKGMKNSTLKKLKVYVTKKMSKKEFNELKKQLIAAGVQAKNIKRYS